MRKQVYGKKLSRSKTARDAMYRSLTSALVEYGKIETTEAKAKGVQPYIEKLSRLEKKADLSSRRSVLAKLANDKKTEKGLFDQISIAKRNSGYTRIIPLPRRKGDNTKMARLEWVDQRKEPVKKSKAKKTKESTISKVKSKVTRSTEK